MESKKISQLATELSPDLSDLTIIGDPTTGISKKITLSQMASLFTGTVEEYANLAAFPLVGVADTIYIALDTNILYRWNTGTSAYVELSPNIVSSLVFNDANGFDGTINLVGSVATLTITTALTTGSVGFIGASGALLQDNANFFWDDTNNRLGLGTNAPTTALDVFGSGIIGRINGTSTNNAFLGFASAGTNKWSIGNVQSDHRFRIYNEATTSELVSVLSTGEFGIGIANPTTKFHIDGAASALIANLDANVSVAKSISFRSDNSNRINLEVSGTESGSNAGADFFLRAYSDAGALLSTPLTILRSTGFMFFGNVPSGTNYTKYNFNVGTDQNIGFRSSGGFATLEATNDSVTINTPIQFAGSGYYFGSGGSVGISTTSPVALLDVYSGFQSIFKGDTGVGTTGAGIYFSHYGPTRTNLTGAGIFSLRDDGDSNYHGLAFKIHNSGTATDAAVTAMRIFSNGLVSVNETYSSTNYKFAVKGSSYLAGTNNKGLFITDNASYTSVVGLNKEISSYNPIEFRASGIDYQLYLTTAGNVSIGHVGAGGQRLRVQGEDSGSVNYSLVVANSTTASTFLVRNDGAVQVVGSLSKGSGSFRIDHPLESMTETHQLVHSFIEGPRVDLIYRGKLTLVNGKAQANIDEVATMTEGTFEVLCREVQCFTTNESGWDLIKGKVIGNIIYIESQNPKSTDEISWLVIGERKDKHILGTDWTDENGKVIVEPLKPIKEEIEEQIIEEEIIENINQ